MPPSPGSVNKRRKAEEKVRTWYRVHEQRGRRLMPLCEGLNAQETTLSQMNPGFPSGQLPRSYYAPHRDDPRDAGQDQLVYQQQAGPFPSNLQYNGMVSPMSPSLPHYPNGNWDEPASRYWPNQQSFSSIPSNQSQSNPQLFPSNDLSHIYDQRQLIETNNHHVRGYHGAGRGGTNLQQEILDPQAFGPQTASYSSAPLASSSAMTLDNLPSPMTGFYSQSGVTSGYSRAPSVLRGQVEPAAQSHLPVVAQEHDAATQKPSRRRLSEQSIQKKRVNDAKRKQKYRLNSNQAYVRICELLDIDLMPENTRAQRILEAVEGLVGLFEVVDDLRRQVEESEARIEHLRGSELNTHALTRVNVGSFSSRQGPSYAG